MNLASRGLRDMDAGPEAVGDASERAQVARQARRVHVKSLLTAIAATAVVMVVR